MNKAVNTIARGIEAGALKAGASIYMQSDTQMPPYNPEKPNSVMTLTLLAGKEDDVETWTEEDWGVIRVSGSGEIAGKEDSNEDVYVNNGEKVVLTAEVKPEYEFKGYYTGDTVELITRSKTMILQIPDDGVSPMLVLAEKK